MLECLSTLLTLERLSKTMSATMISKTVLGTAFVSATFEGALVKLNRKSEMNSLPTNMKS